jgi:predicted ATP-grasp superfamily ATP-dependent carboligase
MNLVRVLLASTCTPDDRKMLAAARALARRGVQVSAGSNAFLGMAYWSRAVRHRLLYPHPSPDPAPFLHHLRSLLQAHPHDVLLPMNDDTTLALARHPSALDGLTRTVLPPMDSIELARDKFEITLLAQRLGLEIPETRLAASPGELPAAANAIGYPAVLKFRSGSGAVGLHFLSGPIDWDRLPTPQSPLGLGFNPSQFLLQRRVPGRTHDVVTLCHHGEIRAALSMIRLRTFPVEAGVTVESLTTRAPHLLERAATLLRALRWHGPALVEFMEDPLTRQCWFIEVNGRLWGGLAAAIHAGLDIPFLLCQMALHGDIEPHLDYRAGARFRWSPPLSLLHLAHAPDKPAALHALFGPARGAGGDFLWSDPAPQLAEFLYAAQRALARRRLKPARPPVSLPPSPDPRETPPPPPASPIS